MTGPLRTCPTCSAKIEVWVGDPIPQHYDNRLNVPWDCPSVGSVYRTMVYRQSGRAKWHSKKDGATVWSCGYGPMPGISEERTPLHELTDKSQLCSRCYPRPQPAG